ncbi:MAG: polysaccharide deacetylase family protein [Clostridia bacterium]|nr:polysaccharide deacetylase family protein [Clostridia bacterium]
MILFSKKSKILLALLSVVVALTICTSFVLVFANTRLVPVYKVKRQDNKIAISFDAAWGADKTLGILDICDQYGVKVTFFLVSFWMEAYPDMVAEIARRGHEIGTHSKTHPQMSKLSKEEIKEELTYSVGQIVAITGQEVTLFRPPFGDYDNKLIDVATSLNLATIQWSVDSLDWKGLSGQEIATRVQKAKPGDIILCHNNSDHILDALPAIFQWAKIKGLEFVTIGQLLHQNYTIEKDGTMVPTDKITGDFK